MLIGRSVESGALEQLLEDARGGRSRALVLRGEPGVGKSALLERARDLAAGVLVLRATGVESESELAFAGVHQLVRPILGRAPNLPGPQAAALASAFGFEGDAPPDRFLVSVGLLGLVADAAEDQPVLCLVDDAHWVDRPSVEALVFAARRLEAERVAILFSARDVDDRLAGSGIPELVVPRLDAAAARELLAERLGPALAPAVRERLIEATGGNPLALIEVAGTLSTEQVAGHRPLPDPLPLGPDLERAFLTRVRRLPEAAQRVLVLAAADDAGDSGAVARAAATLELSISSLADAERADLVHVAGDAIQFRHPLVRSAIYRSATFAERHAAHDALADAYGDADEDRRAWHRAAAAVGPDEAVAEDLERSAARAWSRSGYSAAGAALARAADLTRDDDLRARRLADAAEATWLGGDSERARVLLHAAQRLPSTQVAVRIAGIRGRIEIRAGNPADGYEILLDAARRAVDPETATALLVAATEAVMITGETSRAIAVGELAEQVAAGGESDQRSLLAFMIAHGRLMAGDPAGAVPLLHEAIEGTRGTADAESLMHGALAAMALGDDETAREISYRAVERVRAAGAVGMLPIALTRLVYTEWRLSRFADAHVHAAEALRLALETEQEAATQYTVLALVEAALGREADCRAHAAEARRLAAERQIGVVFANTAWALGVLELGLGRPAEALACLEPIVCSDPGSSAQPVSALMMTPDAIEAAARSGSTGRAQAMLARYETWAKSAAQPWALALVARCHGLLSEGATAQQQLESALELHVATGRPFERARTELALGETLRRNRKRLEAREHLRAAAATFGRLGAAPWEERAQNELRATGETVRKRDVSTVGELTPQELQIARLVATGARNREIGAQLFLSPRTVEYHLRKVFMKLGISSRAELARMDIGAEEQVPAENL